MMSRQGHSWHTEWWGQRCGGRKECGLFGDSKQLREVTANGGEHESQEVAKMSGSTAVQMLLASSNRNPNQKSLNNEPILLAHTTRYPEMGWLQGWLILCGSVTLSRTQIYPSFCSAIPSELTSISAVGPHGHKMGARVPHITCEHYDIKEKKRDHFLPLFLCFIIKETFLQGLSFPH